MDIYEITEIQDICNLIWIEVGKITKNIVIASKNYMNNCLYIWKNEIVTNDLKKLIRYLHDKNINIKVTENFPYRITECNGKKCYGYHNNRMWEMFSENKELKAVSFFEKIEINYKTKTISIKKFDFKPFSIKIEDGLPYIRKWYKETKSFVDELGDKFIPVLTGGVDTRILSVFWRNNKKLKKYILEAVKWDGMNHTDIGKREIETSRKILDKLGFGEMERIPFLGGVTISGKWTDLGTTDSLLNSIEELEAYTRTTDNLLNGLPFLNKNYLILKHPETEFMRILFSLLFCDDLLDINYYSTDNLNNYNYRERFSEKFKKCEKLIEKWGGFNYVKDYIMS